MEQQKTGIWKVKVGKIKDLWSRWGNRCSHGLICPLIPNCVVRWVQSTLQCGFAKWGPQPTVDSLSKLQLSAWGPENLPGCTILQRQQCLPVKALCEMLLFGHVSWDLMGLSQSAMSGHTQTHLEMLISLPNLGCHWKKHWNQLILASQRHKLKTCSQSFSCIQLLLCSTYQFFGTFLH